MRSVALTREVGLARVGHVGRQIEEGLFFVVEVRGDDELAGGGEAEALADVVEACLGGYGEGGGGEDDGGVVVEEGGGEEFGDVDGGGLEVGVEGGVGCAAGEVADSAGGAALDPEDGVGVGGFEEEVEVGADVGGALAQAGGLFDVFDALELAFEAGEGVEDAGVGVAALFEEFFAVVEGHAAGACGSAGVFAGERRRRGGSGL